MFFSTHKRPFQPNIYIYTLTFFAYGVFFSNPKTYNPTELILSSVYRPSGMHYSPIIALYCNSRDVEPEASSSQKPAPHSPVADPRSWADRCSKAPAPEDRR